MPLCHVVHMTIDLPSRRGLLTGVAAFIAAPAIVRASSLMPVKAVRVLSTPSQLYLAMGQAAGFVWNGTNWITLDGTIPKPSGDGVALTLPPPTSQGVGQTVTVFNEGSRAVFIQGDGVWVKPI